MNIRVALVLAALIAIAPICLSNRVTTAAPTVGAAQATQPAADNRTSAEAIGRFAIMDVPFIDHPQTSQGIHYLIRLDTATGKTWVCGVTSEGPGHWQEFK